MVFLFEDSSRWRGWTLSALFVVSMCAAPLAVVSDTLPSDPLHSRAAAADVRVRVNDSSLGAQPPAADRLRGGPGQGPVPFALAELLQIGPQHGEGERPPIPLTDKQKREMLKSEFDKMKRDAAEMAALAQSLQEDFEKSDEHILSLKILEKAQKIEALAKKISKTAKNY